MNKQIIDELVELEIFNSKILTKDQYNEFSQNNTEDDMLYLSGQYDYGEEGSDINKWFKQIDTKGLSNEEIKLLLEIDRTKNIRSIKKMAIFFVVLTLVSIVIAIWSGTSIASML